MVSPLTRRPGRMIPIAAVADKGDAVPCEGGVPEDVIRVPVGVDDVSDPSLGGPRRAISLAISMLPPASTTATVSGPTLAMSRALSGVVIAICAKWTWSPGVTEWMCNGCTGIALPLLVLSEAPRVLRQASVRATASNHPSTGRCALSPGEPDDSGQSGRREPTPCLEQPGCGRAIGAKKQLRTVWPRPTVPVASGFKGLRW